VSDLRRKLLAANERNLNAIDAVTGAEAAAAQAGKDIDGIFDRLHRREQELKALKELLGFTLETPLAEIARSLDRSVEQPGRGPAEARDG
jgi:hypothetical protein